MTSPVVVGNRWVGEVLPGRRPAPPSLPLPPLVQVPVLVPMCLQPPFLLSCNVVDLDVSLIFVKISNFAENF